MSDAKLSVLLQESQHVQDAISRAIGHVYTIFGVITPSFFGLALFLADKNTSLVPIEYLSLALVTFVSLAVLFCSSLYMEAFEHIKYKYHVLTPRMYKITDQEHEENFGQYQARTRPQETWIPTSIFQVAVFIASGVFSIYGIRTGAADNSSQIWLLGIAITFLGAAAIGLIYTWRAAMLLTKLLGRSCPDKIGDTND